MLGPLDPQPVGHRHRGGLPDRACAWASALVPSYVSWFALEEYRARESPATTGQDSDSDEAVQAYLSSLPPEHFPNFLAVVDDLAAGNPEGRFEFGLQVLTTGLAAQARVD